MNVNIEDDYNQLQVRERRLAAQLEWHREQLL